MSKKKKEPIKCRHCGVELSWKELTNTLCFVCSRDKEEKCRRYSERGGLVRQGRM